MATQQAPDSACLAAYNACNASNPYSRIVGNPNYILSVIYDNKCLSTLVDCLDAVIQSGVGASTSAIKQAADTASQNVIVSIDQDFVDVGSVVHARSNELTQVINTLATQTQSNTTDSFNAILKLIDDGLGRVAGDSLDLSTFISDSLNDIVDEFIQHLTDAEDRIINDVAGQNQEQQKLLLGAEQQIIDTANSQSALITELVDFIATGEADVAQALRDMLAYLQAKDAASQAPTALGGILSLLQPVLNVVGDLTNFKDHDAYDQRNKMVELAGAFAEKSETFAQLQQGSFPLSGLGAFIVSALGGVLVLKDVLQELWAPDMEEFTQDLFETKPTRQIDAMVALAAAIKDPARRETVSRIFHRAGLSDEMLDTAYAASTAVLDPTTLTTAFFRGLITDDGYADNLRKAAYTDEQIALFRGLRGFIPPVSDLVSMAVKEAFTPDIATLFGQYEDFPQEFGDIAATLGVSDKFAKAYWAAHWQLPSPQMAFTMFQRGIINQDERDKLLRALDIMPFWRERLTQLSYNPLNTIQVRQMNAIGLLDHADMVRAYQDNGHSPDDAERLAQFTEIYNTEVSRVGKDRNLAEAKVREFYEEGLLDREGAATHLLSLGYSQSDAELILNGMDIELAHKHRKDAIALIVAKASKHLITLDQAQADLSQLGATQDEHDLAVARIVRAKDSRTDVPPVAMLKDMFAAGVIDAQALHDGLAAHGFSDVWIARMIQLFGAKAHGKAS